MNLYKIETVQGSVYGPIYAAADSYGEAERLVGDRKIKEIAVVRCDSLLIQDCNEPGTDAYIDELESRIQAAMDYMHESWSSKPETLHEFREDLTNIAALLDGRTDDE